METKSPAKSTTGSILVTGATGFVGSSLAARLLKDGKRVVALSRKDPDGVKTRSAVERAARTLGLSLSPSSVTESLRVISAPLEEASTALTDSILADVEMVWHSAALLSYDIGRLTDSMEINVAGTTKLYRAMAARAPRCRRFYHISTAFAVGLPAPTLAEGQLIPEELHLCPRSPNVYQLSKWSAEMALRVQSMEHRLPVTLLRPSVVVGHSKTGLYHGDPFGIYMFFLAGIRLTLQGVRQLNLSPETRGTVNLIPVDVLVENAIQLTRRDGPTRPAFEVIHDTGTVVSADSVARAGQRALGLTASFDGTLSPVDRQFAQAVEQNQIFAAHAFRFAESRMAALLGSSQVRTTVSEDTLVTLITSYKQRVLREMGLSPQAEEQTARNFQPERPSTDSLITGR